MEKLVAIFVVCLMVNPAQAESIFKCMVNGQLKYQSSACPQEIESKKIEVHTHSPDEFAIERLKEQRLEFLKKTNPDEYEVQRRSFLTPEERKLDDQQKAIEVELQKQKKLAEVEQQKLIKKYIKENCSSNIGHVVINDMVSGGGMTCK